MVLNYDNRKKCEMKVVKQTKMCYKNDFYKGGQKERMKEEQTFQFFKC